MSAGKIIMRDIMATTTAEAIKPLSGVAGSSSACYPSQRVLPKFK
jgi:Na+-transporting methylmalonyl-CoA/oxaloacetate decarboxylase beta subunit